MPLDEEGAKWSCEPCIRGHRSSKCQHFDRLMMKVPKAGRPLAKCPHPKGTCSCQKTYAVMVRIPKGSSCLCRPLYEVPMDSNDSTQSSTSPMTTTPSPAPGKVQKSGRRQSIMQAPPENIARALDKIPDTRDLKIEDGTSNILSNVPLQSGKDGSLQAAQTSSPQETIQQNSQSPPVASCCSQKAKVPTQAPVPAPPPVQNGGSCCGSRPSTSSQAGHQELNKQQPQPSTTWNDRSYMHFSDPQASSWQNPTMDPHGNFMHPAMNQQQFPQNGYIQMLPPHSQPHMSHDRISLHVTSAPTMPYYSSMNGLGINQPSMDPFMLNNMQSAYNVPQGDDPCGDCNCGDDCQCLGCATHPFNVTTRKHVQEMGAIITNGDERTPEAANFYQSSPFQGRTTSNGFPYYVPNTSSFDHSFQQHQFDGYSDPSSTLPNGYSSPLSTNHQMNQELMHPSEYYTFEYPVGLPNTCSDLTGSCQCGSDCSCVGCLTHSGHSGVPLDMSGPEHPISDTAEPHESSQHPHPSSTMPQSSRIPALDNVSGPYIGPRTFEPSMI